MHHFSPCFLKLSQQFQLFKNRFKQHQNAPCFLLAFKFSQQFQFPKYRFKQHQKAPFCVLAFKMFSAVPTSERVCSYSVRMHHLLPMLSTFSHHFQLPKPSLKMRKNASFRVLSFKTFTAVPTLVYRSVLQAMSRHVVICEHSLIVLYYSYTYLSRSHRPACRQSDKMNVCIIEDV